MLLILIPNRFFFLIFIIASFILNNATKAQCISTFPYIEDFEVNDGNWSINGSQPDWAWGTPSKAVINKAGGGNNCWITGGLSGSFYNNGEASWLQSPCFDFSTLQQPYLKFKVFWETEGDFDGANLQYSIDEGISWENVGSVSTPTTCLNTNWYNTASVSFLSAFTSVRGGWSGNIQSSTGGCRGGGGSGDWVVADQLMKELAAQKSVIFRFTFAAGTQCNNFDGFAIDDIFIGEAPLNSGTIYNDCIDSNTVSFRFLTEQCPNMYSWNFNDAASGAENFSDLQNPTHIFSAPGIYNISVTVSSDGKSNFTDTKTILILGLKTQVVVPINCNGDSKGSVKVVVSGSPGPFDFEWNTEPPQTADVATGLNAGTYNVNVAVANGCPVSSSIILDNPIIKVDSILEQPGCKLEKGKISLEVTGGIPPYSYSWMPMVSAGFSAENLNPGFYTVTISDSRPCSLQYNFIIATLSKPLLTITKIEDANCDGTKKGTATATVLDGSPPYIYSWNNLPGQISETATNLLPGEYFANVTDANGCTVTKSVKIDVGGICNDIYFPNAIVPGSDKNNSFGPLGNVLEMSNYSLSIFNRFGERVFNTNNALIRWNAFYKGNKASAGVYVWYSTYIYKKKLRKSRHGTVMIIH